MPSPRTFKKRIYSYQIALVPEDEGGYTVLVPSLPGCISYGRDIDNAVEMAKEAIELQLENLQAHRDALPDERTRRVLNTTVDVAISRG